MCLLIGPPSVGKTLLSKRLNSCSNRGNYNDVGTTPATIPTVGTNLVNVVVGRKAEVTVRELGGCMAPIWHNYYKDCHALMFMVDMAKHVQLSASCIQFLEVLVHPKMQKVPVLLILNKIDETSCMKRLEFESVLRLSDIQKYAKQSITVVEISAQNGKGIIDVAKWIQEHGKQEKS